MWLETGYSAQPRSRAVQHSSVNYTNNLERTDTEGGEGGGGFDPVTLSLL